ncbi:MAG: hypothetical protein HDR26_09895 [Lachnospiraceae bacterium]|nr:hypothetical protein [Lachnospiraceae bacterium]
MRKVWFGVLAAAVFAAGLLGWGMKVQAREDGRIKTGVLVGWAEDQRVMDLSGMTAMEAENAIAEYIEQLKSVELTLIAGGGNEVSVTVGQLGISWANPEIVQEAVQLGTQGNVIQRYKALKDLEHKNKVFEIRLKADEQAIQAFLEENCTQYDQTAVDMSLRRENGEFVIVDGQPGYALDVEASAAMVCSFLADGWGHDAAQVELDVAVMQPRGSVEELSMVKDVLGSYTTSFSTSNSSRQVNVKNGCKLIDGVTLYPGDEFSAADAAGPFTAKNGYQEAGAFLNGKVVESFGGGICQVSTTLYNAVLRAELDVTMRYNHSMIVSYVEPSEDAAIATSSGKDFKFVNNTDYPVYIEGYTTSNKELVFNIYGVETRDASRTVEYISEVLEVINPPADTIYPDASQPLGYIKTESAHVGYKARLWKVVRENGVEVSREQVNSSSYKMVPRSAVVGVSTEDPYAYQQIMAAIATSDINYVKAVIAVLTAPAPAQ